MKKLKRLIASLSVLAVIFSVHTVNASAITSRSNSTNQESGVKTTVVISDPETGASWKWDVPKSDVSINSLTPDLKTNSLIKNNGITKTDVSVSLGKYLEQTFDQATLESLSKSSKVRSLGKNSTLEDDITLSTGVYYSTSGNSISVSGVYGSTTPRGLYYATNRTVYWRNPGAGLGGTFYPSSNSWSYSTDSTYGDYDSTTPPYSILDCEIHISGMSAYRSVSVTCEVP